MKMNMMMIVHAFRLASCLHSYQVASRMENIFIFQSSIKKTKKIKSWLYTLQIISINIDDSVQRKHINKKILFFRLTSLNISEVCLE
jgi:hypothetical protein